MDVKIDAAVAEAMRKEGLAPLASLEPAAPAKVVDLARARARRETPAGECLWRRPPWCSS